MVSPGKGGFLTEGSRTVLRGDRDPSRGLPLTAGHRISSAFTRVTLLGTWETLCSMSSPWACALCCVGRVLWTLGS